jgi:hypothetical protein
MSTTTEAAAATQASSLASSTTFKTFAVVFAIATPVIYVICEMQNWPLFTYHPATNRIDLGRAPAVRDQGPAMYWYGWTATTLIGAAVLGALVTLVPERLTRRIPLALVWIMPILAVPTLIYALRFFWRW